MHGRCCARRLAVCLLISVVPLSAHGQNVPDTGADFARTFTPRAAPLSAPDRIWREPTLPRPVPLPPGTIGFPQIARAAGIIFSGTVTSISRVPASTGESPQVVAVTFRVERAIRGTTTGRDLTIFQWIGLWTSGQRYRTGERLLLFFYPPSKLGLTSCVGGSMGRFTLDPLGWVVLSEEHLAAFGADPVLGGKSRVKMRDFVQAVRRARGEE
jgi:hypothetical protein